MEIKVKVTKKRARDAVEVLRERAAECIERHVSAPSATRDEFSKPLDLWEAKLCLEIAKLFRETES